ncbi:MAG: DUF4307 domain-containing protein [Mycobacterium leprae]
MTTTRPADAPHLAGRYGTPRGRGPAVYAAVGTLAAGGLAWVVWAGVHHASPDVNAGLVSWRVRSDRAVDVVVEVRTKPGIRATSDLLARDIHHVPVGQTAVDVRDGRRDDFVSARLPTSRRAVSVELTGCRPVGAR